MRIVSRFHDFYDIGMGLAFDDSIDYIRTPREVLIRADRRDESIEDKATRDLAKSLPASLSNYDTQYGFRFKVIGFCGSFYPVVVFKPLDPKPIYCYSIAEVDKYLMAALNKKSLEVYLGRRYSVRNSLVRCFTAYEDFKMLEPFILNRSPIVLLLEPHDQTTNKAVWNARLRDYNFEKILDPYQAFQSIEMFLGNLAEPSKPIPPRTDIEKVESHGFDKKISFRKGKKDA